MTPMVGDSGYPPPPMTLTKLHLRLLAALLTASWTAFGVVFLATYRPGVAAPILLATFVPALLAAISLWRPPTDAAGRGQAAAPWLSLVALLVLVATIASIIDLRGDGLRRPFAPSAELWRAIVVALLLTAVFTALGLAASVRGVPRAGRIAAVVATVLVSTLVGAAGVAGATSVDLAEAVPPSFWETVGRDEAPTRCHDALVVMPAAVVTVTATLTVDGVQHGDVELAGDRVGNDERWHADLATSTRTGTVGYVAKGGRAWRAIDDGAWQPAPHLRAGALDRAIVAAVDEADRQAAVEDVGEERLGSLPARRCRAQVRGPGAFQAFPALRPLARLDLASEEPMLHFWQGELEWWVFREGEVALGRVGIEGLPPREWSRSGIQGRLEARLIAADRTPPQAIEVPE